MTTRRRSVLVVAGAVGLLAQARALAQTGAPSLRLGILRSTAPAPEVPHAMLDVLRDAGYAPGTNLVIEQRFAGGRLERLPALAHELLRLKVDVLVCVSFAAVDACRKATSTVPIIMYGNFDPVALGLVTNLARPEANVTGILIAADGTLAAKRIGLLRELMPRAERVAILVTTDPAMRVQVDETRDAAKALGMALDVVETREGGYAAAFARMAHRRPDALVVGASPFFFLERKPIIALAAQYRLPAVYEWPDHARDGGLLAYGSSRDQLWARIGTYVDLLRRGRKPADLPVEQPTTYQLVLNLRTARTLNLVVPQSLRLRADEVIQ